MKLLSDARVSLSGTGYDRRSHLLRTSIAKVESSSNDEHWLRYRDTVITQFTNPGQSTKLVQAKIQISVHESIALLTDRVRLKPIKIPESVDNTWNL
jgi:hypothetical protein